MVKNATKRQRIHSGEISLAVRNIHGSPQNSCGQSRHDATHRVFGGGLSGRCVSQKTGAKKHQHGSAEYAEPTTHACVPQFVEQSDSPQDADQAIHVPQGKRNAQADIADGKDSQRIGDRPEATGEHSPNHQVRRLPQVPADLAGAANQRRHAPAGKKDSRDHQQGNHDRRYSDGYQFGRSFCGTQPGSCAEATENADRLELAQAVVRDGRLRDGDH